MRCQTARSRDGECAIQDNFTLLTAIDALARLSKTSRFQAQRCDDGRRVVEFKDEDISLHGAPASFLHGHRIYRSLEVLQGRKTPLERLA
jgi:hypothetical protein